MTPLVKKPAISPQDGQLISDPNWPARTHLNLFALLQRVIASETQKSRRICLEKSSTAPNISEFQRQYPEPAKYVAQPQRIQKLLFYRFCPMSSLCVLSSNSIDLSQMSQQQATNTTNVCEPNYINSIRLSFNSDRWKWECVDLLHISNIDSLTR